MTQQTFMKVMAVSVIVMVAGSLSGMAYESISYHSKAEADAWHRGYAAGIVEQNPTWLDRTLKKRGCEVLE
jgi:hypothetical protein